MAPQNTSLVSYGLKGKNVEIQLGKFAAYRRKVDAGNEVFRVCNGKNTKKCGYWENIKTKKKVAKAAKTTRKNGDTLVLKNVTTDDAGEYMIKLNDQNFVRLMIM